MDLNLCELLGIDVEAIALRLAQEDDSSDGCSSDMNGPDNTDM